MKYASPVCDSLGRIHQNKCIFEIAKCRSEKIEKVQINQKDCTTIENTNKSNLNNIFKEDLSIYNNFTFDPLVYTFKSNFTNKDTTKKYEVESFNASKRTTKKTFNDDLTLTLVTTTPFQSSTNSNYIIL